MRLELKNRKELRGERRPSDLQVLQTATEKNSEWVQTSKIEIVQEGETMRLAAILTFCIFLLGCARTVNPVPQGFTGPTATLSDSGTTGNYVQMFWVADINGKGIPNSYDASMAASQGQGFLLKKRYLTRRIEAAKPQRVRIMGDYVSSAPIVLLFNTARGVRTIVGTVEFTPRPGRSYIVTGKLGKDGAIWIEDAKTHEIVTRKVVTRGW